MWLIRDKILSALPDWALMPRLNGNHQRQLFNISLYSLEFFPVYNSNHHYRLHIAGALVQLQ